MIRMRFIFSGHMPGGHPDDESDLDLLVVVRDSDEKSHRRCIVGRHVLFDLNIAKDLLVYTQDEFDTRLSDSSTLVYKVKNNGKVLYAPPTPRLRRVGRS
jgi:uncharacterized protein